MAGRGRAHAAGTGRTKPGRRTERKFERGASVDLGAFDRTKPDRGASDFLARTAGVLDWVCLMEDRAPTFFLGYDGYSPRAAVPLSRHGPRRERWSHADLRVLVGALRRRGVDVLLGFWVHECTFVDDDHPELLMRDERGVLWRDDVEQSADFNPLKRMRADARRGIAEGARFVEYVVRQWGRLKADFGFDGLFLGDGGMGFRRYSRDADGVRAFDLDAAWVAEFTESEHHVPHRGCALLRPGPGGDARRARDAAADVHRHHWDGWLAFATERWTEFYGVLARAVHATGGFLAAYNVMNFDPSLARLHGVDYRALAEAGLDVLVFQTYDYAWGPLGPFRPPEKDLATNLAGLLATKAYLAGTATRVLFTTETGDSVERWDAPMAHTLGEVYAYGTAQLGTPDGWRRAVDGTFVVWANETPASEWALLGSAFRELERPREPPARVTVWHDADAARLARAGPESHGYAHLERGADGILRAEHARGLAAKLPSPRARRT